MRRAVAAGILALAAASAAFAAAGLAVTPHLDPPGTPRFHDHVLAAYRYPAFLIRMATRLDRGPRFTLVAPVFELAAGLVLATLAVPVPRLPRARRRPAGAPPPVAIRHAQWRPTLPSPPPRGLTLPAIG